MSPLRWWESGGKFKKKWWNKIAGWYNSIGLFNEQTYMFLVNPIVIIFWHQQYGICPLKQNLFGWFTYKGFLTATCWNNRTVRVKSAAGKTVHKLFVGCVCHFIKQNLSKWKCRHTGGIICFMHNYGCHLDWLWIFCVLNSWSELTACVTITT